MSDRLLFDFKIYENKFKKPLLTNHGVWKTRTGIIISLNDETGNTGWGEIAPLPWFGSETLERAREFCERAGKIITTNAIATIPDSLPACQFAFESALEDLNRDNKNVDFNLKYSYLLPAGIAAIAKAQNILLSRSHNSPITFKWKIAVGKLEQEISILKELVSLLPETAKLRLDANGGFNLLQAEKLLKVVANIPLIEYVEQPLSPDNFVDLLLLNKDYNTPLALDESVANLTQLEEFYRRGWRGVYIIKAAIMGYPSRLSQFLGKNKIDAVFSSVFETKVGRRAVLNLASKLGNRNRAVGFSLEEF